MSHAPLQMVLHDATTTHTSAADTVTKPDTPGTDNLVVKPITDTPPADNTDVTAEIANVDSSSSSSSSTSDSDEVAAKAAICPLGKWAK